MDIYSKVFDCMCDHDKSIEYLQLAYDVEKEVRAKEMEKSIASNTNLVTYGKKIKRKSS